MRFFISVYHFISSSFKVKPPGIMIFNYILRYQAVDAQDMAKVCGLLTSASIASINEI